MAGIIAIGASQGGVEALRNIVATLPQSFDAPVLVVVHIGAGKSILPRILSRMDDIPASHAIDGEKIRNRHIYIAPPDHHMLVSDGHIRLSRAPRENWARPAIDPLFRTVAYAFGADAVGVILTGNLNDGTAGLYEIKRCGGRTIVQDPAKAEAPSMPQSAADNVAVDYCVTLAEIPDLLARLTSQPGRQKKETIGVPAMSNQEENFSRPVAQTCPECGGAMREERLGTLSQFRCHIGHVLTAEVLATAKLEMLENDISTCVMAAHERSELCREIARKHESQGDDATARKWRAAAEQAAERTRILTSFSEKEWIDPTNGGQPG